jgi:predicted membrane chloride channel (bestrophin family)
MVAIGLLVIGAMFMVTKELAFTPEFKLVLEDIPEWSIVLKAMLFKAPFIAPVIWLALFASTRRNQYARLKQEYAHKEALATSYESYKKQISDLGLASNELQQRLIESAIDAIAFNASTTLDKRHTEKLPLQELMDKLSFEEVKKLLDFFKKNATASKVDDASH